MDGLNNASQPKWLQVDDDLVRQPQRVGRLPGRRQGRRTGRGCRTATTATCPSRPSRPPRSATSSSTTPPSASTCRGSGVPVVVTISYFPNWQVSGAEGVYRVSPNLMVVVPTSHHVSLWYGTRPSTTKAMGSASGPDRPGRPGPPPPRGHGVRAPAGLGRRRGCTDDGLPGHSGRVPAGSERAPVGGAKSCRGARPAGMAHWCARPARPGPNGGGVASHGPEPGPEPGGWAPLDWAPGPWSPPAPLRRRPPPAGPPPARTSAPAPGTGTWPTTPGITASLPKAEVTRGHPFC